MSLSAPSAECINKLLVGIHQTALSVNLRSSPLDRFLDAFPNLSARDHVVVHVYAMGLPETLQDLALLIGRTPLEVSQSLHLFTIGLLDLESRLSVFGKDEGYKQIIKQFSNLLASVT